MKIDIPHKFTPRPYQVPFLRAMDSGILRAVLVWHRRSGKDKSALNMLVKKTFERVGTYYYVFPYLNQGKKIIWDGIDGDGMKFLDHVPSELVRSRNESEMRIELVNGSAIQIIGVDKVDRIIGTNPIGCIFSEYSVQRPEAWNLIRPILKENGGWAVFIYTPRGLNHGFRLYEMAKKNDKWFSQLLTINDTNVLTEQDVEDEIKAGMPEDLAQQEYLCKFIAGASQYFKRIEENTRKPDENVSPEEGKVYQIGVDLGKHRDYTVITPFDRHTFHVAQQDRFRKLDWVLQKARIEAAYHRWNKSPIILDSTGIGDPILDDLQARGIGVTPYNFTQKSREALLENLRLLLAQDRIKLPYDEDLLSELNAFQYDVVESPGGRPRVKIGVPEDTHDDMVMSLALAVWDAGQPITYQPRGGWRRKKNVFLEGEGLYSSQSFD